MFITEKETRVAAKWRRQITNLHSMDLEGLERQESLWMTAKAWRTKRESPRSGREFSEVTSSHVTLPFKLNFKVIFDGDDKL